MDWQDWQTLRDAIDENEFAEAVRMASSSAESAANAGNAWLALELDLVAAFANFRQHEITTSKEQLQRALSQLSRLEQQVPRSALESRTELVQATDQAAVLACCMGDLSLGERLFAQAGKEIDRLFRAYSIADLMRSAYHRALALVLANRRRDADAHIALASHIAGRVLARHENHPESKAIDALRELVDVRDAQTLPFWFFVGRVPFATSAAHAGGAIT